MFRGTTVTLYMFNHNSKSDRWPLAHLCSNSNQILSHIGETGTPKQVPPIKHYYPIMQQDRQKNRLRLKIGMLVLFFVLDELKITSDFPFSLAIAAMTPKDNKRTSSAASREIVFGI